MSYRLGIIVLIFLIPAMLGLAFKDQASSYRFFTVSANKSPYIPTLCLADPDTEECLWWISQRGDAWIPWERALILPAGPQPGAVSGGHIMSRNLAHIGPGLGNEVASLKGFALVVNHATDPINHQRNVMEVPNPTEHSEVYFPGRISIGSYSDQGPPQSAIHIQNGYLQLPVWRNNPPDLDCDWPLHQGRVALVKDVATGNDTLSWQVCTMQGWEQLSE